MEGLVDLDQIDKLNELNNESEEEREENEEEEELDEEELIAYTKLKGEHAPRETIVAKEAIEEKLEQLKLRLPDGKSLPWIETLTLTTSEPVVIENVHDDVNRETIFYQHTLEAVKIGLGKFDELGINYKRPNDYFAEMIKSEEHMAKVKEKLLEEKRRLEIAEERKRLREQKKFGKQVQIEKEKEKKKEKKEKIESVSKWRKARGKGIADSSDFPLDLEINPEMSGNSTQKSLKKGNAQTRVNLKRKAKDEKYGFAHKKNSKKNTSESTNDMTGFNGFKAKKGDKKSKIPGGAKLKSKKRPGKNRRQTKG